MKTAISTPLTAISSPAAAEAAIEAKDGMVEYSNVEIAGEKTYSYSRVHARNTLQRDKYSGRHKYENNVRVISRR